MCSSNMVERTTMHEQQFYCHDGAIPIARPTDDLQLDYIGLHARGPCVAVIHTLVPEIVPRMRSSPFITNMPHVSIECTVLGIMINFPDIGLRCAMESKNAAWSGSINVLQGDIGCCATQPHTCCCMCDNHNCRMRSVGISLIQGFDATIATIQKLIAGFCRCFNRTRESVCVCV
jgi:hypothetical protein